MTVEQPVPLSEISLPSSEYGTLSWADESSVPSERAQSWRCRLSLWTQQIFQKSQAGTEALM